MYETNIIKGFNFISKFYDEIYNNWTTNWMRKFTRQIILYFTSNYQKNEKKCLEIGCGTGYDAIWFLQNNWNIFCTDISPKMCQITSNRIHQYYGTSQKKFQIFPWSTQELIPQILRIDQRFNLIYSALGALNCEPNLNQFLYESANLLYDDGLIIVSLMNPYSIWNNIRQLLKLKSGIYRQRTHSLSLGKLKVSAWFYSLSELKSLFSIAYNVELISSFPIILPAPYIFPRVRKSKFLNMIAKIEPILGKTILSNFGDHIVVVAKKK